MKSNTIQSVDFGYTSADEFWAEVVVPAYKQFKAEGNRANAITASVHAWHVHEWIWHDQNRSLAYSSVEAFRNKLFADCPELLWVRDVADAGKHCNLNRRSPPVQRVMNETRFVGPFNTWALNTIPFNTIYSVTTPLIITLTTGGRYYFPQVLSRVIDYWRTKYFP